ncbi:MAG: hypothetical protein ABW118_14000 [Candidatus Thiodiazotropha sp.]
MVSSKAFISARIGGEDKRYIAGADAQAIFNDWVQLCFKSGALDILFSTQALADLMDSAAQSKDVRCR